MGGVGTNFVGKMRSTLPVLWYALRIILRYKRNAQVIEVPPLEQENHRKFCPPLGMGRERDKKKQLGSRPEIMVSNEQVLKPLRVIRPHSLRFSFLCWKSQFNSRT